MSKVAFDVLASLDHTLASDPEVFIDLWLKLGEVGQLLVALGDVSKELLETGLDTTTPRQTLGHVKHFNYILFYHYNIRTCKTPVLFY